MNATYWGVLLAVVTAFNLGVFVGLAMGFVAYCKSKEQNRQLQIELRKRCD